MLPKLELVMSRYKQGSRYRYLIVLLSISFALIGCSQAANMRRPGDYLDSTERHLLEDRGAGWLRCGSAATAVSCGECQHCWPGRGDAWDTRVLYHEGASRGISGQQDGLQYLHHGEQLGNVTPDRCVYQRRAGKR